MTFCSTSCARELFWCVQLQELKMGRCDYFKEFHNFMPQKGEKKFINRSVVCARVKWSVKRTKQASVQ